ncbi:MAG: hypothetical protein GXP10_03680, partial [Gammaproteobacteria bacterium]|nr:hypothetical protein [Gammaproteobacteria bacterium]
ADSRVTAVQSQLQQLGLAGPKMGDDVVACSGTSTCRLGITSSRLAAQALNGGDHDLRIRVSGCHNSCAQHHVGDIGLHGEGKRLFGRLIPHYALHIGGNGCGGGAVAVNGPEIPTQRIVAAVARIEQAFAADGGGQRDFFRWSRAQQPGYFQELLGDLSNIREEDAAALAKDLGGPTPFKVLQLGGGECAGAAQELISSNFSEAAHERSYRDAFILQRCFDQALECCEEICRLVGNSLLFICGHNALHDLAGIGDKLVSNAADSGSVDESGKQLSAIITALRQQRELFDVQGFEQLSAEIDRWTNGAAQRCQRADGQLDLSHTLPDDQPQQGAAHIIDLSAFGCPLHYIKARNELRKFDVGNEVTFIFDSDESAEQVSNSLANDGHTILPLEQADPTSIKVRRE